MTPFLSLIIRPHRKRSDGVYLLLALLTGGFFGGVMGLKISLAAGLAIGVFSTLVLYTMWRSPV